MNTVRATAPASIGNLAAGFDALGAAIEPLDGEPWADIVEVSSAASFSFTAVGPCASTLPADATANLVVRVARLFEEVLGYAGRTMPLLSVTLHKNLPLSSGLGSSSSSIVAALVAYNTAAGDPMSRGGLLQLAGEAEGIHTGSQHFDNVAPALLGGVRIVARGADGMPPELPWPDDLLFAVVHPAVELTTALSRAALPAAWPRATVVEYGQNIASLVHALHTGDRFLLRGALRDPLAEPHRAALVPGFVDVQRAAREAGAIGCSFSGSGPSVFAVASAADAGRVAEAMRSSFERAGVPATARVCRVNRVGARVV